MERRPCTSSPRGTTATAASSSNEFHVTDATKPFASAAAIAKLANRVVMEGPGGYIQNERTGSRIDLKLKGGVYVFDIEVDAGFSRRG